MGKEVMTEKWRMFRRVWKMLVRKNGMDLLVSFMVLMAMSILPAELSIDFLFCLTCFEV